MLFYQDNRGSRSRERFELFTPNGAFFEEIKDYAWHTASSR